MKLVINTENINQITSYEEGSFSEIDFGETLDFVKFQERQKLLSFVLSKLQFGGIINIQGLDIKLLAHYVLYETNNLQDINVLLERGSYSDINTICTELKQAGLSIEYKNIGSCRYTIKAKK